MYTDPSHVRADIPGTVEGNPVFIYHAAFNLNRDEVNDLETRYRAGTVGDVEVKRKLVVAINSLLDPMRERRVWNRLQRAAESFSASSEGRIQSEEEKRCLEC